MEFKWSIRKMSVLNVGEQIVDYVVEIDYVVETVNTPVIAEFPGTIKYEYASLPSEYVPYEELTEETVVSWVKSALQYGGVAEIENELAAAILERTMTPSEKQLPWI